MMKCNDDVSLLRPPGRPSPAAGVESRWTAWILSPFFVLFLLPLVLFVVSLPVMPLMEPDETRYALIPQYMNLTGDYVTPHLKGVAYLEKPPLAYWVTAPLTGDNLSPVDFFPLPSVNQGRLFSPPPAPAGRTARRWRRKPPPV